MSHWPRTREEAEQYRYGKWAGRPIGTAYMRGFCAAEVYEPMSRLFHQCQYRAKTGPGNLYCGIHAKRVPCRALAGDAPAGAGE